MALPVHIHDNVEIIVALLTASPMFAAKHECQRPAVIRPIRLPGADAVPANIGIAAADIIAMLQMMPVAEHWMRMAEGDAIFHEAKQFPMLIQAVPIEPVHFAVVTIRIIVAVAGLADFIAHQNHRHALAEHQYGNGVFHLPPPQPENVPIAGRPFATAIPAKIIVRAVPIIFAVRLVMLLVVGDQIHQREAVVTGDKVNRSRCAAPRIEVRRSGQAQRHVADLIRIAAQETAHGIAIFAVPFRPAAIRRERADLIQAAGVPRLGNQFAFA